MTGAAAPKAPSKTATKPATPMMVQYMAIRDTAGDALLFYRMGDFYELFFDDAIRASAALDITLTKRGQHQGADIPMCGVPYHASESYIARLIKAGFKVAICEQTEDPAQAKKRGGKSVVRREIVRVMTPGTLTEDTLLEARSSNYLVTISILKGSDRKAALAWADVSTGDVFVRETGPAALKADLAALGPREILHPELDTLSVGWQKLMLEIEENLDQARFTAQAKPLFDSVTGERRLCDAYKVGSLDGFGSFTRPELSALGCLFGYIGLTQIGKMPSLKAPQKTKPGAVLAIDQTTRVSLELTQVQNGTRKGSLLDAIDKTVTGPGGRMLHGWISAPLTDVEMIRQRQSVVQFFHQARPARDETRTHLKQVPDMARSLARLSLGRGGPRDIASIGAGLVGARALATSLAQTSSGLVAGVMPDQLSTALHDLEAVTEGGFADLVSLVSRALAAELPLLARDGGFIAQGFDPALDDVRGLRDNARRVIADLQNKYRQQADVKPLKIKHNNVLGYFIETPPSHAAKLLEAPLNESFIHRQTLVSAVRFTTVELSELDAKIVRARDQALAREMELYDELINALLGRQEDIAACAEGLALIDVVAGLAQLAEDQDYVCPIVDDSTEFNIEKGRHPVVEQAVGATGSAGFIPNDCHLSDQGAPCLWLVTGPNMAGKSTFLRQNALIMVLAQAGSFVPARRAHIGVADRLFSRVGAADDLARGRSTFMVEMVETAAILHQAGPRSLVILDEIGRGTATFDGLSIAWAAVENLHEVNRCRGLFATHYHELTALSEKLDRLRNVSMRVREWEGDVVFLHEVVAGQADRSYGVAVGRLAGLPAAVVARAEDVLSLLEQGRTTHGAMPTALIEDLPLFNAAKAPVAADPAMNKDPLRDALEKIDPDSLSPREALQALYDLKSRLS